MEIDVLALSRRFESCGQNCELGFALRKIGNEDGQLLRWAVVPPEALATLLREGPAGLYSYENLEPTADDMVLDRKFGLSFHTSFRFRQSEQGWVATQSEEERVRCYEEDASKIGYMAEKFFRRLQMSSTVFLYKASEALTGIQRDELCEAFHVASSGASAHLLIVEEDAKSAPCEFEYLSERVLRTSIAEFVDNKFSDSATYASWLELMVAASHKLPNFFEIAE